MQRRVTAALLAASILGLSPAPSRAALSNYIQNFEGLVQTDTGALAGDGWLVYGNVFDPTPIPPGPPVYLYGYGPFPAPNDGAAFCAIVLGEGGPDQGAQQLSVYSDYNNVDHANLNLVESNVFRETTIGATDVGSTWTFEFDAKLGNLAGGTTAIAFIKTLNPAAGYALTNFLTLDMTSIPVTWNRYSISIPIDASLPNQILQIGFASTATNYEPSAVFYDNIVFHNAVTTAVESSGSQARPVATASVAPNPLNPAGVLSFRTSSSGPVVVEAFDHGGRLVRTLLDSRALPAGSHRIPIDGRDQNGRRLASGVYFYRVETPDGTMRGKFSIMK